jgi:hypothetical protein
MKKGIIEITQANIDKLPDYTGIYKIFAYQIDVDEPVKIGRFVKDDITGLVYIGMSLKQSLRNRLKTSKIA